MSLTGIVKARVVHYPVPWADRTRGVYSAMQASIRQTDDRVDVMLARLSPADSKSCANSAAVRSLLPLVPTSISMLSIFAGVREFAQVRDPIATRHPRWLLGEIVLPAWRKPLLKMD